MSHSSNAIFARFSGVQDDILAREYLLDVKSHLKDMAVANWARIVDLSDWQITVPDANRKMIESLQQDGAFGLTLEAIVLPTLQVGIWQVENTIAAVQSETDFVLVKSQDEALAVLREGGFDTQFSHCHTCKTR